MAKQKFNRKGSAARSGAARPSLEHVYGIHAVESVLNTHPERIIRLLITERHDQRIERLLTLGQRLGLVQQTENKQWFERHLADVNHQGIVAECKPAPILGEDALAEIIAREAAPLLLVLDQVQDPHNLGACLRSANAAGVHAVIVPKDNSSGLTPVVRKIASGAAELTPFIQITNLARVLKELQEQSIWVVGLAGETDTSIHQADFNGGVAIVMGAEGTGLRRLTRENCDQLVKIPMVGQVESLNVSVATGIALFEVCRQRSQ